MASAASTIIQDIVQQGKAYEKTPDGAAQQALLKSAIRLIAELETPIDQANKIVWGDPGRTAAIKIALELGLFQKLNDNQALNSVQLAGDSSADPVLLARVMKILSAYSLVNEVGKDQYQSTPFTTAVAHDASVIGALKSGFAAMTPAVTATPDFLAQTNFQVPNGFSKGPFQHAMNTDKTLFGFLAENPPIASAFKNYMAGFNKTDTPWVDLYPCPERLTVTNKDEIVLIDVGGGVGHELLKFHTKYPGHAGRLITQDLAAGLSTIQDTNGQSSPVEPVEQDFFTPQPSKYKGAKAYYLRHILHNWPDEKCKVILSHLRDAMTPGYSKILVNEIVVDDFGSPWRQACMDWLMLSLLSAKERTESEWRDLFESVGLKVSGIWRDPSGDHGIIEAVLAQD